MERIKFPKIGEVIKEVFSSFDFINDAKTRKQLNRLAKEEGSNLDEVQKIIKEVFNSKNSNKEDILVYIKNQKKYQYNKNFLELIHLNLTKFIENYKNEVLRKLDDETQTDEILQNKFTNIFEEFKRNTINGILELSKFKYMNYQGEKKKSYYYDQIKLKLLKEVKEDNFNYLNTPLQNEVGEVSKKYHLINELGKKKNTDAVIKNTVDIFQLENNNSIFLTLTIIMARFEKTFIFENLNFLFIKNIEEFGDYDKYIGKYSKDKDYGQVLKKLKGDVLNYSYVNNIDIKPMLREGISLSSHLGDKKGYNFFYMYANYFGLIFEDRKEAEWRYEHAKKNSKVASKNNSQSSFHIISEDITNEIPNFWKSPKGPTIEFHGRKRSRIEILCRYYPNLENPKAKDIFKKTEEDVLDEIKKLIELGEDASYINTTGETALLASLLDFNCSYKRALLLLEEAPNIEESINAKSKMKKNTVLIKFLDDLIYPNRFLENKEVFIKVLEKLLEKNADPNLSGRPEENMPLALLIRIFNTYFFDNTRIQEKEIREINKDVFPRYENVILDNDYGQFLGTSLEYKKLKNENDNYLKKRQTILLRDHKTDLLKCCKLLLDAGANLNLSISPKTDITLFHYIIECGDLDLFNLALNYDINFDSTIKSNGREVKLEEIPLIINKSNKFKLFDSEKNKINRINMCSILLEKRMSQICK